MPYSLTLTESLPSAFPPLQIDGNSYHARFPPVGASISDGALEFLVERHSIHQGRLPLVRQAFVGAALQFLITEKAFLLHASAMEIGGKVWAFMAPSGTGKSTVSNILKEYGQKKIADDLMVIQNTDGIWLAGGTSFCEDRVLPLGGFFILERSSKWESSPPLPLPLAFRSLLQQTLLWDSQEEIRLALMDLLSVLAKDIAVCRLGFSLKLTGIPSFIRKLENS